MLASVATLNKLQSLAKVPEGVCLSLVHSMPSPTNLLVFAVSATHHLQSEAALFKRMVSMSGTNLLMSPLPAQVTESTYKTITERLGLSSLSPSERVKTLVQMDSDTILSAVRPSNALLPSMGGVLNVKPHTYAEIYQGLAGPLDLPGRSWCQEIMVGDCQFDVRTAPVHPEWSHSWLTLDYRRVSSV